MITLHHHCVSPQRNDFMHEFNLHICPHTQHCMHVHTHALVQGTSALPYSHFTCICTHMHTTHAHTYRFPQSSQGGGGASGGGPPGSQQLGGDAEEDDLYG